MGDEGRGLDGWSDDGGGYSVCPAPSNEGNGARRRVRRRARRAVEPVPLSSCSLAAPSRLERYHFSLPRLISIARASQRSLSDLGRSL